MLKSTFNKFVFAAMLVGTSFAVEAAPYTFEFVLPSWDVFPSGSFGNLGSNGILDITVDNGSASAKSQNFLNSQITQLRLEVAGGSFSHTWTSGFSGDGTASFVTTDDQGIPTLDLLGGKGRVAYYMADDPTAYFQLGIFDTDAGSYYCPVCVGDKIGGSDAGILVLAIPSGIAFTGTLVASPVPEPESYAMLLAGLGVVGALARRRKS